MSSLSSEPQRYDETNIRYNEKKLRYIHDFTSLVFGLSAGILNFESYHGFIYFAAVYLITNVLYYVAVTEAKPHLFYRNPLKVFLLDNLWSSLTAFLMAWTFAYALIQS